MKKIISVKLVIPVTINAEADDQSAFVEITSVLGVEIPSLSTIRDAYTENNLVAIDKAWEDTESV